MTTIGLTMIVKDEAETLPRLAESLKGQIDRWTIVDTGSTDGTLDLIPDLFSDVPGELLVSPWEGFGPCRNVALEAARPHTDLVLRMDGDETLHGELCRDVPESYGAIECEVHWTSEVNWIPRLVRTDLDWRWIGRTREYIACTARTLTWMTKSFHIEHHALRETNPEKLRRDIILLERDLEDRPNDPRIMFYLGRTYLELGQPGMAAGWLIRRCVLQNFPEEDWYALYLLGVAQLGMGMENMGIKTLYTAWNARPNRMEPLAAMARYQANRGQWDDCRRTCTYLGGTCPQGPGEDDRLFLIPHLGEETVYQLREMAQEAGQTI